MTKYWFRKRRGLFVGGDLGWGWRPISWEGWLLTIGFILGLYNFAIMELRVKWFLFILLIFLFMFIADLKTENKVLFK